jgi:hypothetical protein
VLSARSRILLIIQRFVDRLLHEAAKLRSTLSQRSQVVRANLQLCCFDRSF